MSVTNTPTIESRTRPRETAAQLLSVEEARARVVAVMPLLESEPVDLKHARGRVTAEDVRARRDHPAAAISAMDGYALRLADVTQLPARPKDRRLTGRSEFRQPSLARLLRPHLHRRHDSGGRRHDRVAGRRF